MAVNLAIYAGIMAGVLWWQRRAGDRDRRREADAVSRTQRAYR